jgi:C-terminal processing protease CtpA/Prc
VLIKISEPAINSVSGLRKWTSLKGQVITDISSVEDNKQDKPDAFFKGKIYLLIDNGVFSSGVLFASTFRDYEIGEIIGYETGEVPESCGELLWRHLQNSQIVFGVSCKKFYPPKPKPGDDEHGVLPNVPITDEILSKYKSSPDPVLAYTIDRIKSQRGIGEPKNEISVKQITEKTEHIEIKKSFLQSVWAYFKNLFS